MILVFLGSWRNTIVVITSIPCSMFAGIICLYLTGNTINLMTLGGLALATGILVDDATVAVENIHRNRALGKPLTVAILDGSHEVALPRTMATLAICIVFFPVTFLFGVSKYLFTPLALSVVFSLLASYVLSFTLVPMLSRYLLAGEKHEDAGHSGRRRAWLIVSIRCARHVLDGLRDWYGGLLALLMRHRLVRAAADGAVGAVSARARARRGNRLLPAGRRGHHEAALPRAGGPAHRGDREARAAGRGRDPQDHPSSRSWRPSTTWWVCRSSSTSRSYPPTTSAAWTPRS